VGIRTPQPPLSCSSLTCRRSISAAPSRRFFHLASLRSSHSRQLRHQAELRRRSHKPTQPSYPGKQHPRHQLCLGHVATSPPVHARDYTDSTPASSYYATSEPWPKVATHWATTKLPRRAYLLHRDAVRPRHVEPRPRSPCRGTTDSLHRRPCDPAVSPLRRHRASPQPGVFVSAPLPPPMGTAATPT
jgi:hypothetical protein